MENSDAVVQTTPEDKAEREAKSILHDVLVALSILADQQGLVQTANGHDTEMSSDPPFIDSQEAVRVSIPSHCNVAEMDEGVAGEYC